jgi:hypothetical protein
VPTGERTVVPLTKGPPSALRPFNSACQLMAVLRPVAGQSTRLTRQASNQDESILTSDPDAIRFMAYEELALGA